MRIVVSESAGFAAAAATVLQELGEVTWGDFDRERLLHSLSDAEVLWVRLRHAIDERIMNSAPRLRWIATPTTGLNHIDLEAAASRAIQVLSLRGEVEFLSSLRATAELTLALMLALLRHVPDAVEHARAGLWNRDLFRGLELHRRVVGIVGYGRLGKIVARYLLAFGAQVMATDRRPVVADPDVKVVDLAELLGQSHIVTLHADLVPENAGFFDRNCFRRMKPDSFFVNTARGELIDEGALIDGLRSGRLAGAALDVVTHEWSADKTAHPLVKYASRHSNLLLTPHIGGCTAESMSQAETFLAALLRSRVAWGS
jgi:D-3-phosphoglycerate dehydrogenase